jgi:general secretion pathway protein M
MVLPTGWPGRLLAVAILLMAALVIWLGVVSPLVGFYQDRGQELAQRRALAERMTAIHALLPRLKAEAAKRADPAGPPSLLLDGGSDALAAAGLQERLTKAATATGIVLLSAEGAPVVNVGAVRRIGLKINASGKFASLVGFLERIDQSTPPLLVDELQIQGLPYQGGAHALVRLTVFGFRPGEKDK